VQAYALARAEKAGAVLSTLAGGGGVPDGGGDVRGGGVPFDPPVEGWAPGLTRNVNRPTVLRGPIGGGQDLTGHAGISSSWILALYTPGHQLPPSLCGSSETRTRAPDRTSRVRMSMEVMQALAPLGADAVTRS
jgi:hypothetical protein